MTDKKHIKKQFENIELASSPCFINDVDPDYVGLQNIEPGSSKKPPVKKDLKKSASKNRKRK